MISLIFLYSLFNYIILYLCTLRKLTLLPPFSSISLSPQKTLTLVVPLALIPHWQLNKSAEKHVLSADQFQFKLMITHPYQVFSTAWLSLYFNGCSLPTLRDEAMSQFSYRPSLFWDAAHPLCTHFLMPAFVRDEHAGFHQSQDLGTCSPACAFATPGLSSCYIPSFHRFILLNLIIPTSVNTFSWFLPLDPAIFLSSPLEKKHSRRVDWSCCLHLLFIPLLPQPAPMGLYSHSSETVLH